jgi:hypothetical protein
VQRASPRGDAVTHLGGVIAWMRARIAQPTTTPHAARVWVIEESAMRA